MLACFSSARLRSQTNEEQISPFANFDQIKVGPTSGEDHKHKQCRPVRGAGGPPARWGTHLIRKQTSFLVCYFSCNIQTIFIFIPCSGGLHNQGGGAGGAPQVPAERRPHLQLQHARDQTPRVLGTDLLPQLHEYFGDQEEGREAGPARCQADAGNP